MDNIYIENDDLLRESFQIDQLITKTEKDIAGIRKRKTLKLLSCSNRKLTQGYYLIQQNERSK